MLRHEVAVVRGQASRISSSSWRRRTTQAAALAAYPAAFVGSVFCNATKMLVTIAMASEDRARREDWEGRRRGAVPAFGLRDGVEAKRRK